jgi:hypothetical protein
MSRFSHVVFSTVVLALTACANMPTGPAVMVLPGTGISLDRFSNDNTVCQQFALAQVGGLSPNQAAINNGVASAALGTAIGASSGEAVGAGAASSSMEVNQQRYDVAYIQCMFAKGHQVPVSGQFTPSQSQISPAAAMPPPPDAKHPPITDPISTQQPESSANIPPPPPQ